MTDDELRELKRANDLKEQEIKSLSRIADAQAQLAHEAQKPKGWEKFWYGPTGRAGHYSRRYY